MSVTKNPAVNYSSSQKQTKPYFMSRLTFPKTYLNSQYLTAFTYGLVLGDRN